jgi:hypothetical protein
MRRLLDEMRGATAALRGDAARQAAVLEAGLALVAGVPAGAAPAGTVTDVLELVAAVVPARTQAMGVQVIGPLPNAAVPAPAAIALAIVQLAVNAQQHAGARRAFLRVGPGPTFTVEWAEGRPPAGQVRSHRHALRRTGWGWGYVQMVADALGGVALPPGPTGPGLVGACVGLGSTRLALPVACVRGDRVERATEAWDQDPAMPARDEPASAPALAGLLAAAAERPGRIAYHDLYRARLVRDRTWVVMAPESGSSRARDLLRGLHHERALWSAPEPHATRVAALATLLQVALGEPWPSAPPGVYAEVLPAACAAIGVALPEPLDVVAPPDPRIVAFMLGEVGGRLVQRGDEVWLAAADAAHPLLRALAAGPGGWLRVSG